MDSRTALKQGPSLINNQRGQFVIEAILLMTLLIGLSVYFVRTFRENNVLASVVETPWDMTAGMIESGTWTPAAQAPTKVPYQFERYYTPINP